MGGRQAERKLVGMDEGTERKCARQASGESLTWITIHLRSTNQTQIPHRSTYSYFHQSTRCIMLAEVSSACLLASDIFSFHGLVYFLKVHTHTEVSTTVKSSKPDLILCTYSMWSPFTYSVAAGDDCGDMNFPENLRNLGKSKSSWLLQNDFEIMIV